MTRAVSIAGLAGRSLFRIPFNVTTTSDLTVKVNGVTAAFTFVDGAVILTTPLAVTSTVDISAPGEVTTSGTGKSATPLGYAQLTGLSVVKGLPSIPAGATYALVQCSTQAVRWRDDGTNPTASVGERLLVDKELVYDGVDLTAVKFIEMVAGAILDVSYYA